MSRKRNALYRETKAGMEALGTYKSEFEAPIKGTWNCACSTTY